MPLSYKNDNKPDDRLNPYQQQARELQEADQQAAYDRDFESMAKRNEDFDRAADKNAGIDQLRDGETTPWTTNMSQSPTQPRGWRKTFTRISGRKAATGGLIGGIFAALLGIGVMITPSIGILHMAETFVDGLDDSVAALDKTSFKVFKAKFKDLGKKGSVCAKSLPKFRCGLRGMTDKEIKNFEKAGIKVEKGTKNKLTGKNAVISLTFTDSKNQPLKVTNPGDFNRRMAGDMNIRSQLRRAYNPKFYSVSDALSSKIFGRLGLSRENKFKGNSLDENEKTYKETTRGTAGELGDADKVKSGDSDEDKERDNATNETNRKLKELVQKHSGASGLLRAGLKGIGPLGAGDNGCTAIALGRGVEAGGKVLRSRQLAKYSSSFMNFAFALKAGDATPGAAEMWGNVLTKTDTNKKIVSETSDVSEDGELQETDNPYYGKGAFESAGYRTVAYNEAPTLTARDAAMTVGGGLVGTLGRVVNRFDFSRSTCKAIQNPFVRGGSLVIGLLGGVVSGGTTLAISIAASVGVNIGIQILAGYLKDMVAGTTVSEKTKGVDAGNAAMVGTSVIFGNLALARGMQPANIKRLSSYQKLSAEVNSELIAMEREDAKATPFDATKQYSFLGSIARTMLSASGSSTIAKFSPLTHLSALSTLPISTAYAKEFNADRYKKCTDTAYKELKIDADIFCNVRYAMSNEELNMDVDPVYEYMDENKYVDDEGNPVEGDYLDWYNECAAGRLDQEGGGDPIGADTQSESGDEHIGRSCMDEDEDSTYTQEQLKNFRVYTFSRSVESAQDEGPDLTYTAEGTVGSADFRVVSINSLNGLAHAGPSNGICRRFGGGTGANCMRARSKKLAEFVNTKHHAQIVGTQENNGIQLPAQKAALPGWDSYPKTYSRTAGGERAILYDTKKFTFVRGGVLKYPWYRNVGYMPWVQLQSTTAGEGSVFVYNTHPVSSGFPRNGPVMGITNYGQKREKTAQIIRDHIKANLPSGAIAVITGDFNSKAVITRKDFGVGRSQLPYCVLTADGKISHTFDINRGEGGKPCPHKGGMPIDHIYASTGVRVPSYKVDKAVGQITDHHSAIIADIKSEGDEGATSGSFAWPVDKKYWKANRSDFLSGHTFATGTAWGGDNMGTSGKGSGIASDIGLPPDGSPVYAMFSGKVTSTSLCGANDGIAIKSNINGATLGVAYMHGTKKRFKVGDTVNAGDHIMSLGTIGCSVHGGHVHIGIAYNGKYVCPQDVFLSFDKNKFPDFKSLVPKGKSPCDRA